MSLDTLAVAAIVIAAALFAARRLFSRKAGCGCGCDCGSSCAPGNRQESGPGCGCGHGLGDLRPGEPKSR